MIVSLLIPIFATSKSLMSNTKRLIAVIAMMCAAMLMVTTSMLPHHHHDGGAICLSLDWHSDNEAEHNHSHNACTDDCAMNVEIIQDASQPGHAMKVWFIPSLTAILSWDNTLLPDPDEKRITQLFYYILPCDAGIVGSPCGLRAPPAVA